MKIRILPENSLRSFYEYQIVIIYGKKTLNGYRNRYSSTPWLSARLPPFPAHVCHTSSGNGSNSSSGDYITAERAQQIALAETPSGSTVVKCQFDWDDGRAQYEVEIRNGWTEYEFEIDAVTGTIFSRDIDNDRW